MFDLPDTKRVRRSDLYRISSRSQSSAPSDEEIDPELEAELQSRIAGIYGDALDSSVFNNITRETEILGHNESKKQDEEQPQEQGFEFRLFSTTTKSNADLTTPDNTLQKIVLIDDEEQAGQGGGFVRTRDPRIWVVAKAQGQKLQEFMDTAVTGEHILQDAQKRHWGLEVPWRVRTIKVCLDFGPHDRKSTRDPGEGISKRKKPGKKRRVILRQRMKKIRDEAAKKRKEMDEREEAEKEKRTRRNREKKVKRKMKEKAKKSGIENVQPDTDMRDVAS